jgi:hypothetical protein
VTKNTHLNTALYHAGGHGGKAPKNSLPPVPQNLPATPQTGGNAASPKSPALKKPIRYTPGARP